MRKTGGTWAPTRHLSLGGGPRGPPSKSQLRKQSNTLKRLDKLEGSQGLGRGRGRGRGRGQGRGRGRGRGQGRGQRSRYTRTEEDISKRLDRLEGSSHPSTRYPFAARDAPSVSSAADKVAVLWQNKVAADARKQKRIEEEAVKKASEKKASEKKDKESKLAASMVKDFETESQGKLKKKKSKKKKSK
jgi:hypothetical protein